MYIGVLIKGYFSRARSEYIKAASTLLQRNLETALFLQIMLISVPSSTLSQKHPELFINAHRIRGI